METRKAAIFAPDDRKYALQSACHSACQLMATCHTWTIQRNPRPNSKPNTHKIEGQGECCASSSLDMSGGHCLHPGKYSISASQPPNHCWMVPVKDYCYSYHIAILVALMKARNRNAVHTPITRVSPTMTPLRIECIDGPRATGDRTRGVLAADLERRRNPNGRRYSKLDT
jgi:hypothetical protein